MIMEFTPVTLLYDICLMSFLIFIAKIIRTKIKLFQRLYIPTALIAGFLGVLGGPFGLNILPFSSQASSYSGILIAVLFATMYLGRQEKASFKEMLDGVGDTFFLNTASEIGQYGVAILFGVFVLGVLFPGIHVCFCNDDAGRVCRRTWDSGGDWQRFGKCRLGRRTHNRSDFCDVWTSSRYIRRNSGYQFLCPERLYTDY